MSKPKFEIDDAVKIGYGSKVYYVQQIEQDSNGFWAYALKGADGSTPRAVESMLSKASLLEDEAIKAKTVCFGQALEALKEGKKVFREKWTGQILWARLDKDIENRFLAKFAGLSIAPYTMSNEDLLACDWIIMIDEEKRPYPDRIPVPENIRFVLKMSEKNGPMFFLLSPNGKMILGQLRGFPLVKPLSTSLLGNKAYLLPCKRSDLKPGDIGFREHLSKRPEADHISQYSVILDDTDYAFWKNEMDMHIGDLAEDFAEIQWYKVIFE